MSKSNYRNSNKGKRGKGKDMERSKTKTNSRSNCNNANTRDTNSSDSRDVSRGANDLNWYFNSSVMMNDVASFPFSNALTDSVYWNPCNNPKNAQISTPGIMRIGLSPTIGTDAKVKGALYSTRADDAINTAAKSIYSFIRHANSGHTNYDSPDLMMYLLQMDSLYMAYSWLVRLYGVSRLFNFKNRWVPDSLMRAMGIKNPQSLRAQAPNLRALINTLALRLSSFAVPTNMPYVRRHLWLYQNVFLDRPGAKAQIYFFDPDVLYQLHEKTTDALGYLGIFQMPDIVDNGDQVGQLADWINNLLAPIVGSEDIGIMSGDILKAYGPSGIYAFGDMPENYTIIPQYVEGVLPEIHNLVSARWIQDSSYAVGDIKQNTEGLIFQTFSNGMLNPSTVDRPYPDSWLVDIPYDVISPEDVTYATRLMCLRDNSSGPDITHTPVCASEIVTSLDLIDFNGNAPKSVRQFINFNANSQTPVAATDVDGWQEAFLSTAFDWFPRIVVKNTTDGLVNNHWILEDITNYTVMNYQDLKNLNKAIMINMFGIPYTLTGEAK